MCNLCSDLELTILLLIGSHVYARVIQADAQRKGLFLTIIKLKIETISTLLFWQRLKNLLLQLFCIHKANQFPIQAVLVGNAFAAKNICGLQLESSISVSHSTNECHGSDI